MSPIADSAACTLREIVSPTPHTACVSPIIGDRPGKAHATVTGAPG